MRTFSRNHSAPRVSLFRDNKTAAIESFFSFSRGEEIPLWPLEVFLEISNVCNLQCGMCSIFSALNENRLLSFAQEERGFLDVEALYGPMEEILKHSLLVHCSGFGEPTIHPSFMNIIEQLSRFEVMIDFFSNGMKLTPAMCEFLVNNKVGSITLSFSGTNKEEYENVYLGGIFEKVVAGIQRLAQEKTQAGSCFPIIQINSLAFQHQVNKFDDFVEMMTGLGANVIHLKQLETYDNIPLVRPHAGKFRSEIDGPVLARAKEIGRKSGVYVSTEQFELSPIEASAPSSSSTENCQNEINRWKEYAGQIQPLKPQNSLIKGQVNLLELEEVNMHEQFPLAETLAGNETFYCMEPFKTLYLRQNRYVKPCCFAPHDSPAMGQINPTHAEEVWRGRGYSLLRQAILRGQHSLKTCSTCLDRRMGPKDHSLECLLGKYLDWWSEVFKEQLAPDLREKLSKLGDNAAIAQHWGKNKLQAVQQEVNK